MAFEKGHRMNLGRKRPDLTLRNLIDNPIHKIKHPMLDKHHSEETRTKMKQNHWSKKPGFVHPRGMLGKKGKTPWNKNLSGIKTNDKGLIPWNKNMKGILISNKKGKTYEELYGEKTKEIKKKAVDTRMKNDSYHAWNKNINIWKNKEHPKGMLGKTAWNKNKPWSKEHINKLKKIHLGLHIGEKNGMWLNGKSFEPYSPTFNKEFKNLIRLRDNFCCINCGISEQKHIILTGNKLNAHHIDYNKKNTCLMNCCSLCNKCHSLTNFHRQEWKEYYQEKLSKLYNYQYQCKEVLEMNKN